MKQAKITTAAAKYPVTIEQQKSFSRIETNEDDFNIETFLASATSLVEEYLGCSLITRTMTLFLDRFTTNSEPTRPKPPFSNGTDDWWDGVRQGPVSSLSVRQDRSIELPRPPLLSVTELSTFDEDDTETVYAATNYLVDTESRTGRIVLKSSSTFPTDLREVNGIKIVYQAGYGPEIINVPEQIRNAITRTAGALYEDRGDCPDAETLTQSVMNSLAPFVTGQDLL